jgi:glycosyltransferase involved in cell wall biosynthesis
MLLKKLKTFIFDSMQRAKNNPLVSVIMNCYNCENYLKIAIDSVFSQTYKNWEIIFYDNSSTDASAIIAKSYNHKLIYYKSEHLVPLYSARNLAIKHASGDVVTFLDCDDVWTPDKLKFQIEQYLKGFLVIYGKFNFIDKSGSDIKGVLNKYPVKNIFYFLMMRHNPISIGCIMLDRQLLNDYKFDSNYNLLGDFDLWVRLSCKYPFGFVDRVVELSRQHDDNLSILLKSQWKLEINYFIKKMFKTLPIRQYPFLFIYFVRQKIIQVIFYLNNKKSAS